MLKPKNITLDHNSSFIIPEFSVHSTHKRQKSHFINQIFKSISSSKFKQPRFFSVKSPNIIPRNNLPKIQIDPKSTKNLFKPSKIVKIHMVPQNSVGLNKAESVQYLPKITKPDIGFFSFPKKTVKNLKLKKKNGDKETSISRWANDGNTFLWNLIEDE